MNSLSGLRSYDTILTLDGLSQFDSSIQSQALLIDGSSAMVADINANGHVVKNLASGVNASDSCTFGQMTTADTNLSAALTASYIAADSAITSFTDTTYLKKSGGVITGTISSISVTNPLTFANSTGPLTCSLSAGNASVVNACTLQLASNSSSTLEFRDNSSNVKSSLKYTYGSPGSLGMIVNGVTSLSASDTLCTFGVPLAMSSKKISGLLAGSATTTDAANVQQLEASVLVETNARIAADTVVTNNSVQKSGDTMTGSLTMNGGNIHMGTGYIGLLAGSNPTDAVNLQQMQAADSAQNTAITTAYTAADAVVTNNSVQKTGSIMSGTLTINNIQTCLQATHTASGLYMRLEGGSSSVPNVTIIEMTAGLYGGIDFHDYAGATLGHIRYDTQNTPDQIDFKIGAISPLKLREASVIISQPLAMSSKQITGVQAGTSADHAVNKGQLDTCLALAGGTLTGALAITTASTTPLTVTSSGANTTTLSGATTCNFRVLGATNPAISIGNNVGGTFAQFLYNTTSDLLSYLRWGVEYMSASATALTIKLPVVRTAWSSGETIKRVWMNPSLGNTLNDTSIPTLTNSVLVTTPFNVTGVNNNIIIRTAFEINATGGSNDAFRIVYEFGSTPQTITFNYILPTVTGWRTRIYTNEYMFQPSNLSNPKTILARLYNDSDDTITISDLNWTFSIEEVQL